VRSRNPAAARSAANTQSARRPSLSARRSAPALTARNGASVSIQCEYAISVAFVARSASAAARAAPPAAPGSIRAASQRAESHTVAAAPASERSLDPITPPPAATTGASSAGYPGG
jgi:hypothetical protein